MNRNHEFDTVVRIALSARRGGKRFAERHTLEAALNAGYRVVCADAHGVTMRRRKKHLTLIEPLKSGTNIMMASQDEASED